MDTELYQDWGLISARRVKILITTIMQSAMPDSLPLPRVTETGDGYISIKDPTTGYFLEFGTSIHEGELTIAVENGNAGEARGLGITTALFSQVAEHIIKKFGKPHRFTLAVHEDRGFGVWQAIAKKIGATIVANKTA
jgi:hypothetical protein